MSSRNWIILLIITLILGAGYFYIQSLQNKPISSPQPTTAVTSSPQEATSSPDQTQKNTITVTANGFSPSEIIVKVGDTVTWVNSDSEQHQVNSSPHPTHTDYQPLNTVGLIGAGESKSLTFPTAGTYKYHDHLNPQLTGTVTVE
ncbi:cupredoxin domain-containing protein [Candidatus Daviesbacteria bacterium]|nr:cupredoxin domain-containing protein [Candidatus Daviesbacteria bacterium]